MNTLHLGLGTSDAQGLRYLRKCIRLLKSQNWFTFEAQSSIYSSNAQLPENAPSNWNCTYLNMAIRGSTPLDPPQVLQHIKELERLLGRQVRERWAPREIDIDILTYNNDTIQTPDLSIPHPALLERPFALEPVAEIARSAKLSEEKE